MNTKRKLIKKVIASVLTVAIMLNLGISFNMERGSYTPSVSLSTMSVQAQEEGSDGCDNECQNEKLFGNVMDFLNSDSNGDTLNITSSVNGQITYQTFTSYDTLVVNQQGNYQVITLTRSDSTTVKAKVKTNTAAGGNIFDTIMSLLGW